MRTVGISVDVDSVASHLRGYGIFDATDTSTNYCYAVPRALELFGSLSIRGTFFLIAEEAARYPDQVRSILSAGHEVACHSMTHPVPLNAADPSIVEREVVQAKLRLEEICAAPIAGFRAPSYVLTPDLLTAEIRAGYRYDASSFPSWVLSLMRSRVERLSADRRRLSTCTGSRTWSNPNPHQLEVAGKKLAEIPLLTVPGLRFPVYHTLSYLLPRAVFSGLLRAALLRRAPTSYLLHAVDFLGLEEDDIDRRLVRHPGMNMPLGDKLAKINAILTVLAKYRRTVQLREIADLL